MDTETDTNTDTDMLSRIHTDTDKVHHYHTNTNKGLWVNIWCIGICITPIHRVISPDTDTYTGVKTYTNTDTDAYLLSLPIPNTVTELIELDNPLHDWQPTEYALRYKNLKKSSMW